jgi:hypothetical protein
MRISDMLIADAPAIQPAELLTVVCEATAGLLALTNAVFFERKDGQASALAWTSPSAPAASRIAAREAAWSRAAQLVEGALPDDANESEATASASVSTDDRGLVAMLYIESNRALDGYDRAFLLEIVRRMACARGER